MAEAALAGLVVGYAMGVVASLVGGFVLVEARRKSPFFARAIAPSLSPVALAVPVSLVAFLLWPVIGLPLGLLFAALDQRAAGSLLGAANALFAAVVAAVGLAAVGAATLVLGRAHWAVLAVGASFIGLFGWLLPRLAVLAA